MGPNTDASNNLSAPCVCENLWLGISSEVEVVGETDSGVDVDDEVTTVLVLVVHVMLVVGDNDVDVDVLVTVEGVLVIVQSER